MMMKKSRMSFLKWMMMMYTYLCCATRCDAFSPASRPSTLKSASTTSISTSDSTCTRTRGSRATTPSSAGFEKGIFALFRPTCTRTRTLLHLTSEDSSSSSSSRLSTTPLPLSKEDLRRLRKSKERHVKNMPVMIIDALVPGQHLTFRSRDPCFRALLEHCIEHSFDLGVLGINPHTGQPLCRGVTAKLDSSCILLDPISQALEIRVVGDRRMEVQGEAWLDAETEAFYVADVEFVTPDVDEPFSDEEQRKDARRLSQVLPNAIEAWTQAVIQSKVMDQKGLDQRLQLLGPMPSKLTDRAMWVAALVNDNNHNANNNKNNNSDRVCIEIRPAMLAARNDYDRIVLAVQAVHSSIDHLTGKKRLF